MVTLSEPGVVIDYHSVTPRNWIQLWGGGTQRTSLLTSSPSPGFTWMEDG